MAGARVRLRGVPPSPLTCRMSPPIASTQVENVTDCPSGVHVGDISTTVVAVVSRRAFPAGRFITQTLPSAVKATRRPSGERAGSRISRAVTESPTANEPRTSAPNDWSTSAVNGIDVVLPDGISSRHSFPPKAVTIALSSGSHAEEGRGPSPGGGGGGGGVTPGGRGPVGLNGGGGTHASGCGP